MSFLSETVIMLTEILLWVRDLISVNIWNARWQNPQRSCLLSTGNLFSLLPLDHLLGVSHQGAAVLSQQSSAEIHKVWHKLIEGQEEVSEIGPTCGDRAAWVRAWGPGRRARCQTPSCPGTLSRQNENCEKIFLTGEKYFIRKKNILPVVSRVTEVMATW